MLELCKSLRDELSIGAVSAVGDELVGIREFAHLRCSNRCRYVSEAARRIFPNNDGRVVNRHLLIILFVRCYYIT